MIKINEIFKSTQGEGRNAGCAAVFVRLSGCNIKCPFCDTEHQPYTEMSEADVAAQIMDLRKNANINLVIFTGGEPSLQLNSMKSVIDCIEAMGYIGTVAVESNGTCDPAKFKAIGVDFVTISPKCLWVDNHITSDEMPSWGSANEVKCLYDTTKEYSELNAFLNEIAKNANRGCFLYLQPITDHKDPEMTEKNIHAVLDYITEVDSRWHISMQLQNIWNVR